MDRPNSDYILENNGCMHHSDCFTCPYPDCKLSYRENLMVNAFLQRQRSRQKAYYHRHKEERKAKQREYYYRKKAEKEQSLLEA